MEHIIYEEGTTRNADDQQINFQQTLLNMQHPFLIEPLLTFSVSPSLSASTRPSTVKIRPTTTGPTNPSPTHCNLALKKEVKRGFKAFREAQVCGVSFERAPAWLLALRLNEWSAVLLTPDDEKRLRRCFPQVFNHFRSKLRVVAPPLTTSPSVIEASVWWVSGSTGFADSLVLPSCVPQVAWITGSSRRLPTNIESGTQWLSLSHSKVGGTTTARGKFRLVGVTEEIVIPGDLTRNIGHVLKHSIRPTPCSPTLEEDHYVISSKLSVHQLEKMVLMPSHFSATGWGRRLLDPCELAAAFELPEYLKWDPTFASVLLPTQILRSVMDEVLDVSAPAVQPGSRSRLRLDMALVCDKRRGDGEWLASLNRWLPGSWAVTEIADKAVKSDDAEVNLFPWHQRISLLFPCSRTTFVRLTHFTMRRWRKNVITSFFMYLKVRYGKDWVTLSARRGATKRTRNEPEEAVNVASGRRSGSVGVCGGCDLEAPLGNTRAELLIDLTKGLAILGQVIRSSWWEWSNGSSLLFWRWNGMEQIRSARDGIRIFVKGVLPKAKRMKPLRLPEDQLALVADKINGMVSRGYLSSSGSVRSCLHFFTVPKGPTDVRIVYDGTSCGLNEALWAPNFYLPSSKAASLLLTFSSWMADADFGEMFHNFFMDEAIRKHAGVDISKLSPIRADAGVPQTLVRWTRLFMGMKSSPYNAVRQYYLGEEFARGDPVAKDNPMGYTRIRFNLPGMESYDPSLPKVMKWSEAAGNGRGEVAGDVITFVDDVRIVGYSKENCHQVHRQFTSRMQFLGFQDAPRKFRPPSQMGCGAWTGTIFRVSPDSITKTVSQEKWEKGLSILSSLAVSCESHPTQRPTLDRKQLERDTGFLNHLAMTFEDTTPFLKGFYLTLNSWRPFRDSDDWKISQKEWNKMSVNGRDTGEVSERVGCDEFLTDQDAPATVLASPRLSDDIRALMTLLKGDTPPLVQLRSRHIVSVIFGFGDASGTGLGSTFTCGSGFTYRIGVWGSLETDESSNWKEFTNVVEALEEEGDSGRLDCSEVFMFTDNATVEACAFKGSSSSPKLLSLIIRLKAMATRQGIRLHVFHVAGTRMIAQGTDGVSRGHLAHGVMAGEAMTAFIPIHLTATERSPGLLKWIRSWSGDHSILLDGDGWFQEGHDIEGWSRGSVDNFDRPRLSEGRTYVWSPPPYVADTAIAELRKARIKRQTSAHIFVCPRLCCSLWMKQLFRASDFVFQVLPNSEYWSKEMHEPLLIGVLFPFLRSKPWQLRGSPKMFAMGRQLRGVPEGQEVDRRNLLRKFWTQCLGLRFLPENVVRRLLLIPQDPKLSHS